MKKLNIAILIVLLVFQTILSPISVFADGVDVGEGVTLPNTEETQSSTPYSTNTTCNTPTTSGDSATLVSEACVINASLTNFTMTINGEPINTYDQPLEHDQEAKMTFSFNADLDYGPQVGDYFEFELPPNFLIDFSDAFNGGVGKSEIAPGFSYEAESGKVKVTLTDVDLLKHTGADVPISFDFTSKFNLSDRDEKLDQDFEVPDAIKGSDTVKVTFKPGTANEKMKKSSTLGVYTGDGTNGTELGERYIDWEVWVNEAGKNLSSAKLTDTPKVGNTNGGHVLNSLITVESYEVGLKKVADTPSDSNTYKDFTEITLSGTDAYKITYRTKITLTDEERDGKQSFSNTIALTDTDTANNENTTSGAVTTTYGKALDKSKLSGTNYSSKWEVRYNYNQLNIDEADAWIEDKLPGSHVIKQESIKVDKVSVKEDGTFDKVLEPQKKGIDYDISDVVENGKVVGFKLQFKKDITDAYRITYDAEYKKDNGQKFFTDAKEAITNTVTSGTVSSGKTAGHTLTEGILKKERTSVDFNKKEILWTVTINNDHPTEAITGLTLTDTFDTVNKTGVHTLVDTSNNGIVDPDDISVSVSTGTKKLDSNGFTIENMTINPNSSVTVTYKTSYAISDDGSVTNNGYGNTAVATWKDPVDTSKEYKLTKIADYTPAPATANNGRKTGSYDYATQEFTWLVQVNTNKRDIQGAVLADTLGAGHEIIAGTLGVYKTTLGSGDTSDSKGDRLEELTDYTLSYTEESIKDKARKTGYMLTFSNPLASGKNNEVYLIEYKTKDIDNIVGIGSDEPKYANSGDTYTNSATFTTTTTHTLESTPVPVNNANNLIGKTVSGNVNNNNTDILTWTIDVNKSLSDLKNVVVKDNPSESLMLIQSSIEISQYDVNTSGANASESWKKLSDSSFVHSFENGGFTIDFGNLAKEGYQVRYKTIALGDTGQAFENNAVILFDNSDKLAGNQETDKPVKENLSFSTSNASIDMTKGNLKFYKVGLDPATAKKSTLPGAKFQLIKTIRGTEYIITTQESNSEGVVEFKNINYGSYKLKEIEAPVGYGLMAVRDDIDLNKNTDTNKVPEKSEELVNVKEVSPGNVCDFFTLTVKDINGATVNDTDILLKDSKGNVVYEGETGPSGQVTNIKRPGASGSGTEVQAGEYEVINKTTDDELGNVVVKYAKGECNGETIKACPTFTLTINHLPTDLTGKEVKITHNGTDAEVVLGNLTNGTVTASAPVPQGTYTVYVDDEKMTQTITVDKNCEAEITFVKGCPTFTLTINSLPTELVGKEVTIKKDGTGTPISLGNIDGSSKVTTTALPSGTYTVYVDGQAVTETITVDEKCAAEITFVKGCPTFALTINELPTELSRKEVTIKKDGTGNPISLGNLDDNGKVTTTALPSGTYTVYVDGQAMAKTVTIDENCAAVITFVKGCPTFTLTINNLTAEDNGKAVKLVPENNESEITIGTISSTGTMTFSTSAVPGGVYTVFIDGEELFGKVTVNSQEGCNGTVNTIKACSQFTLTVNQSDGVNQVGEGVKVVIKTTNGDYVTEGETDASGQIIFKDKTQLVEGTKYDVYNSAEVKLGSIDVTYEEGKCAGSVNVPANACPDFTLTIQDVNGIGRENVSFEIKDVTGTISIATGITGTAGKATIPYTVEPGTYKVYEGETELGEITVTDCKATVKPEPPVTPPGPGGGGSTPPPTETPDTPGEENPKPETPGKPGEENPKPETPGKPGEENPKPETPGKPGEENPKPDKPGKPGEETPKPEKPTSPDLDKVIEKIPSLPGVVPSKPVPGESTDTPKYEVPNIPQIVEELKKDPTKLIQTNEELKEFIDMYNNLSPEQQAEIDKLIDMDALKNLQAQLDKEAAKLLAANKDQEKLPQTDNANQTGMMLVGLLLVGMSLVLLRRKWASSAK
ncbi:collagen binding domain-containing protein [Solibacillus sp. CAU 1738]|uniref:collagen binding domain-containing protein n=1 Tax=Solibacillus sp. CAU 1738 TaxID=3140363 RepID=UPI003260D297